MLHFESEETQPVPQNAVSWKNQLTGYGYISFGFICPSAFSVMLQILPPSVKGSVNTFHSNMEHLARVISFQKIHRIQQRSSSKCIYHWTYLSNISEEKHLQVLMFPTGYKFKNNNLKKMFSKTEHFCLQGWYNH